MTRKKSGRPKIKIKSHLTTLRKRAGMSFEDAIKKIGLSKSMLYHLEAGSKRPGSETAKKISKAYGCTFDEIYAPYFNKKEVV